MGSEIAKPTAAILVFVENTDLQACELVDELGFEARNIDEAPATWHLRVTQNQLVLCHPTKAHFALTEDDLIRRSRNKRLPPLVRAIGLGKDRIVLDALGGWGLDGFTLTSYGLNVVVVEINPLVHAMCRDLARRTDRPFSCLLADCEALLTTTEMRYDVIYLDNMFPNHRSKALPARRMQILSEIATTGNLLKLHEQGMHVAKDRVVVKLRRHQKSTLPKPDWTIKGRSVRFDVFKVDS